MRDLVLAVDTTVEHGSIALCEGTRLVAERGIHAPEGFGQVLFGEIKKMLVEANLKLTDCRLFAGAAGPGSFTGVRIALTCVKGFAEALDRPVYGISNLEALAESGSGETRVCLLDARRGEVYAAAYGHHPIPECVLPFDELLRLLPQTGVEFIATDPAHFRARLQGTRFDGAPFAVASRSQAAAMARIAWRKWRAGENGDPAVVKANYVRRPEAERLWQPPA